MPGGGFLQLFILIDVLGIGLLAPVMVRHARAHFKPDKHAQPAEPGAELSQATRERLLKESEAKFEAVMTHSVSQLQKSLETTTGDINNLIKKLAVDVVGKELEEYRAGLVKLHTQAEKDLGGFKQVMDSHEAELKAKLAQEIEIEKQRLIKQIDTKLGDAVGSFLLETLQHNVDLGSQSTYLMALLEEHKADFIKEVDDETPAA